MKRKHDHLSANKWSLPFRCSQCRHPFKTEAYVRSHITKCRSKGGACSNATDLRGFSDLTRGGIRGQVSYLELEGPFPEPPAELKDPFRSSAGAANTGEYKPVSFVRDSADPDPPEGEGGSQPSAAPPPTQAQSSATITWTLQAFQGILKHLRAQLFSSLPQSPLGNLQSPTNAQLFNKLVCTQPAGVLYSPKIFQKEGDNSLFAGVDSTVFPFAEQRLHDLSAFKETTGLNYTETRVLQFCRETNMSVEASNNLLNMLKDENFKTTDIRHNNIQQYRSQIRRNIPDTFEYQTCDIEIGSWYEGKRRLVDDEGNPIQLVYRNAWRGLLNQWSDPKLKGKVYIAPKPNFRDGKRMYSNFGDSIMFQHMQETVKEGSCAACALFASDEAVVHGSLTLYPILCCLANIHEDLRAKGSPYWFVVAYVPSVHSRAVKDFFWGHIREDQRRMRMEDFQREILDLAIRRILEGMEEIMEHGASTIDCNGDARITVPRVVGWLADGAEIPRLTHMAPLTCHICTRPKERNSEIGWQDSDAICSQEEIVAAIEKARRDHYDFENNRIKQSHMGAAETDLLKVRLQLSIISPLSGPLWFIPYFDPTQMVSCNFFFFS